MTIREEVHKIVRDVLLDGEIHKVSELYQALADTLGLTSPQSASRIKYLVEHEQIVHVDRGYYKLGDLQRKNVRVGSSNKIIWSLDRIKTVVFSTSLSGLEALEVSETDVAALRILKEITALADKALALYEDETNE